jgi:histidinol-phosphatase
MAAGRETTGSEDAGGASAGDGEGRGDDLRLALRAVELAAEIALDFFRRGVRTLHKDDGTPVSEADLEVDRQVVDLLTRERPDDRVLSEESGLSGPAGGPGPPGRPGSARRWIVDPIDGTFNFVTGNGTWGTHVALEEDGEVTVGVVSRPVSGRLWWAARGAGAFRQEFTTSSGSGSGSRADDGAGDAEPIRLRVSTAADLAGLRASLWVSDPGEAGDELRRHGVSLATPDLDDVLRLLGGELDTVVGTGMAWDHAPAVVLVEEAGGRFRDPRGGRRLDLTVAVYTNGHVDDQLDPVLGPLLDHGRAES